jgi:hypothetical protein
MSGEVLATLSASAPRRWFAYGSLVLLGGLLVLTGLSGGPAPGWIAFLLVLGLAALWLAERLRRATALTLTLTRTELRDSAGRTLARIADVQRVERGAFAFKPSGGFTLRLAAPMTRSWSPGLWWRAGRRVGVGGVTHSAAGRFMAERIALLLAERDGEGRI